MCPDGSGTELHDQYAPGLAPLLVKGATCPLYDSGAGISSVRPQPIEHIKALSDARRPSAAVDRASGPGRVDPVTHQCRNPITVRLTAARTLSSPLSSSSPARQMRHIGQDAAADAGSRPLQPQQVGVDPVRGGGAFVHQPVAVFGEHLEIAARPVIGRTGGKAWLAGGDAGDRDRIDRVVAWPGPPNPSLEVIKGGTSTTFRSHSSR